jgi:gamma-glutamylcyclotransferase (GGCT)/AIG2-like uncharacterized protein YtfP
LIHRVFAYGSNMHLADLRQWMVERGYEDGRVLGSRAAYLSGWELVWNYRSPVRKGAAANVQRREGVVLPGALLEVDALALEALDRKEGHPERYRRGPELVDVKLVGGETTDAWLYVVTAEYRQPSRVRPRAEYLRLMVEGALHHDLPEWHVEALRRVETL